MASKKKKDKKKDFVKRKLKVGKTAPKADNYTDTSFKAKSIHLPNQVLAQDKDLAHYLSLTKHHAANTRKEVLVHIEKNLPRSSTMYTKIVDAVVPLLLDDSNSVKVALQSLLTKIGSVQPGLLELNSAKIILFVHSAMTNINPDVKHFSTKFLKVLIDQASATLLELYFTKTLKSYFSLMGWSVDDNKASNLPLSNKKALVVHLNVLKSFLEKALSEESAAASRADYHPLTHIYAIPSSSQPYAQLDLFGAISNDGTGDVAARRKALGLYHDKMVLQLRNLMKQGGDISKGCKDVLRVLGETV